MKRVLKSNASIFFFTAALLSLATITPASALINIGGKVVYTYPFPCLGPPGFWSITIKTGLPPVPVPVTYPYIPVAVTKAHFLPGVAGTKTASHGPPGGCFTVIPCKFGLCPIVLPSASVSLQYGVAPLP